GRVRLVGRVLPVAERGGVGGRARCETTARLRAAPVRRDELVVHRWRGARPRSMTLSVKAMLLLVAAVALVAAAAVAVVPVRAAVPNNPSYHCGSPVRRLQAATRHRWDRDSYLTKLGNGSIPDRRLPNRVCRRKGRRRLIVAVGLGGVGVVLAGVAVFALP